MNVIMLINKPINRNKMIFLNISNKSIGLARSASKIKFESFVLMFFNFELASNPDKKSELSLIPVSSTCLKL